VTVGKGKGQAFTIDHEMIERVGVMGMVDSICLSAVLRMSMYKCVCLPEM